MPIYPLPQFETDLAEQDRETYAKLKPPTSVVVKFGAIKMIGEFTYDGGQTPGCGTKFVVKTHRGTELGEMLTSTCPNSGCGKSISRKEMLEYIDNSGGKDYPFFGTGKVLRIATVEDLNAQTRLEDMKVQMTKQARAIAERMNLPCKIADAEAILGGERVTFYFISDDRIDFRHLVDELAAIHKTRIDMRQVGARDEARLVADYEKCGQHCCCKQFLKVLKPISMKAAKTQKATLDPLKISGRCGRLMCCLRYEEQTYDDLRAKLPRKKTRVDTEHGVGYVIDSQILTQLVLVQLEDKPDRVAVPLEELTILAPGQMPGKRTDEDDDDAPAPSDRAPGASAGPPRRPPSPTGPSGPRSDRGPGPRPDTRPPNAQQGPRQQPGQRPSQQPDTQPGGPSQSGGSDSQGRDGPREQQRQSGPRPQSGQGQPRGLMPSQGDRPPTGPTGAAMRSNDSPAQPPRDEVDEIMDMLDGGGPNGPNDAVPSEGGDQQSGPGSSEQRRRGRRRRRGRGSGGGGGGPAAGPPAGQ